MVAVSVVVPAYNMERYVERAVASVLRQSLAELEVLVVDDASRDRTAAIVQGLGYRLKRCAILAFLPKAPEGAAPPLAARG